MGISGCVKMILAAALVLPMSLSAASSKEQPVTSRRPGDTTSVAGRLDREITIRTREAQQLRDQLAALWRSMEAESDSSRVDWLTVLNDIEYLKSEARYLRDLVEGRMDQLVALDDEGFYVAPSPQRRLRALDDQMDSLESRVAVIADRQLRSPVNVPSIGHGRIAITGLIHQQYQHYEGTERKATFVSKRARLGARGEINDYASVKVTGEFASSPRLLDAEVAISFHPNWSLSVGQFKPPFGTDFLTSSSTAPFVSSSLAKGLGTDRDIGVAAAYRYRTEGGSAVQVRAGVFNGAGINCLDANSDKNYVGRVEVTLADVLTLAPGVYFGRTNDSGSFREDVASYAGSATWRAGRQTVAVEYIQCDIGGIRSSGWYVWSGRSIAIGSRFLPEVEVLARFEQFDRDRDSDGDRIYRLTLGSNLVVDQRYTRIQVNYSINGRENGQRENDEFLVNFQLAF